MAHTPPKNIIIIGAGIAGCSTAHYLSISPYLPSGTRITLVEGTKVAAAASGYSGGFLAKDWHGTATASLSTLSYDLHSQLAKEFGGADKWGYRTVDTLSVEYDATRPSKSKSPVSWLPDSMIHASRKLGDQTTNAQVHPGLFTTFLCEQFLTKPNTALVLGRASKLDLDGQGNPTSVTVQLQEGGEKQLDADAVVIAAGPWTGKLSVDLLGQRIGGRLGVQGHRAHSVVVRTKEELSAHCLFTTMSMEDGTQGEPEVYTRPDGTTYICGAGDDAPLPDTAAEVIVSPVLIARLLKQASELSPVFQTSSGAQVIAEQACYLPIADRGRPLVGKVRDIEGVYVGGGLSCWGITQGPGTGLVLSELILEGKAKSADISKLAP